MIIAEIPAALIVGDAPEQWEAREQDTVEMALDVRPAVKVNTNESVNGDHPTLYQQ